MRNIAPIIALLFLAACSGDNMGEQATTDADARGLSDIPVKNGDDNHPPKLHKVGNKEVQIGEELSIVLVADDDDGDSVTFSVYGDIPPDGKFYKPEGKLVWTPTAVSGPFFVTFVVSDLKDFDSETVELRAVATKTQHAPQFEVLGDQFLKMDEIYELHLEASDQDGDMLYFSVLSGMPEAASFDAQNGLFRWTPGTQDAGAQVRVTFSVSDGALADEVEVRMIVEGGGLNNHPPEIQSVGSIDAEVGSKLQFEVKATDPDNDPLGYSIDGALPTGAQFDTTSHVFTWTPGQAFEGKSEFVVFSVTDGTYTVKEMVSILVKAKSSGCANDEFEPGNNSPDTAPLITEGVFANLSICDTDISPIDEDWFKLQLATGEHVEATIESDHALGNLDLPIYKDGDFSTPVFYAPVNGDLETASYAATSAGFYYLRVVGTEAWKYQVPYLLTVIRNTTGSGCAKDGKEPNDSTSTATSLVGEYLEGTPISNLSICPSDTDFYKVQMAIGGSLIASIEFVHADGDLDLLLFDKSGQAIIDSSTSQKDIETVTLDGSTTNAAYYLAVKGYPMETTANNYTLEVLVDQDLSCQPDEFESNDTSGTAASVTQTGKFTGLTLCGDLDYYSLPPSPGSVTATLNTGGSGTISAWFTNSMNTSQKTMLQCSSGQCNGSAALAAMGTQYLVVEGSYGVIYSLDVTIGTGSGTEGSCEGKCSEKSGDCWCDDGCHDYGDCCADVCEVCGFCMTA